MKQQIQFTEIDGGPRFYSLLGFIGLKMLLHDAYKLSTNVSLIVILGILVLSILASLIHNKREA